MNVGAGAGLFVPLFGQSASVGAGGGTPGDTASLSLDQTSLGSNESNLLASLAQLAESLGAQTTAPAPAPPAAGGVEVGMYADDNGENSGLFTTPDGDNHQRINQETINQAVAATGGDPQLHLTTEETNTEAGSGVDGNTTTTASNGGVTSSSTSAGVAPSVQSLADFVNTTLNNSEQSGASTTALELLGHGTDDSALVGPDGTPLEPNQIGQAITLGEQEHAQAHPEDAARKIDTVVGNTCMSDSQQFIDAYSKAGVGTLVGSPNSTVSYSQNFLPLLANPQANAGAISKSILASGAGPDTGGAAPDISVQQLSGTTGGAVSSAMNAVDDSIVSAIAQDPSQRSAVLHVANALPDLDTSQAGETSNKSNKPALALYRGLIASPDVSSTIKDAAQKAVSAIGSGVLGGGTSANAGFPLQGLSQDVGPTTFFPSPDSAPQLTSDTDPNPALTAALYPLS